MTHKPGVQRNALVLAGGITAFALVLVFAVASRVAQEVAQPTAVPVAAAVPTIAPKPGPDPAVQALIDERESAYQELIQQANDRLAEANARLVRASDPPPEPIQAPAAAGPAVIAPEIAAQIALIVAPGSALAQAPGLVNFQGTAAYEVILSSGTVYVDAKSGQVLYNGAMLSVAQGGGGDGGGGGGGRAYDDDDDHENDHEDDGHAEDEHEDHEGEREEHDG
jgi:uncharacterized membrane protein YkoI